MFLLEVGKHVSLKQKDSKSFITWIPVWLSRRHTSNHRKWRHRGWERRKAYIGRWLFWDSRSNSTWFQNSLFSRFCHVEDWSWTHWLRWYGARWSRWRQRSRSRGGGLDWALLDPKSTISISSPGLGLDWPTVCFTSGLVKDTDFLLVDLFRIIEPLFLFLFFLTLSTRKKMQKLQRSIIPHPVKMSAKALPIVNCMFFSSLFEGLLPF